MTFRPELLDELLQGYENPEDLLGNEGILKQLTSALVERCLNAEMKTHLEEQSAEAVSEGKASRNRRNGHSKKTIKGEFGQAEIAIPRDRHSEFTKTSRLSSGWQLTEVQNRGLKDIFIACVDGLTGFADAIEAIFPKTSVQLCIVQMVRNSLDYISYKNRKAVAADLRLIYTASTEAQAEQQLVNFAEKWDKQYPSISKSWINHWQQIIPFFAFPPEIRKAIYTTDAIESLNMTLRKVLKNHRAFPTDDSALKVVYLAIANIAKKWTMPIRCQSKIGRRH